MIQDLRAEVFDLKGKIGSLEGTLRDRDGQIERLQDSEKSRLNVSLRNKFRVFAYLLP